MPFSTFSLYTGNVFTFCSGTGNDALLFYQYIITTAYLANKKKCLHSKPPSSKNVQSCKIQTTTSKLTTQLNVKSNSTVHNDSPFFFSKLQYGEIY